MKRKAFFDNIEIGGSGGEKPERQAPLRFVLIKFGKNKYTIDGNESEFDFAPSHAKLIADEFNRRGRDLVIDYDHGTISDQAVEGKAPAAGWIERLDIGPDGVYAVVKNWTDKARKHLECGEYRYHSPVVNFDEKMNALAVQSVALTNHPAIHGATHLVAANDLGGKEAMDPKEQLDVATDIIDSIKSLKEELDGIIKEVESADKETAQKIQTMLDDALSGKEKKEKKEEPAEAMPAEAAMPPPMEEPMNDIKKALGVAFSDSGSMEREILALKAIRSSAEKFLAMHDAKSFDEISQRLIKSEVDADAKKFEASKALQMNDATLAVAGALKDGKLRESHKAWAMDFAGRDLKAFNDFLSGMPASAQIPKPVSQISMNDLKQPAKLECKKEEKFSDVQVEVAKLFDNEPNKVYSSNK
jgi:phage I-like protein